MWHNMLFFGIGFLAAGLAYKSYKCPLPVCSRVRSLSDLTYDLLAGAVTCTLALLRSGRVIVNYVLYATEM